jgi:formate dehydrogenase assembly factor FdhD
VDKLWGKAMLAGEETADSPLVTTGRIRVVTLAQFHSVAALRTPAMASSTSAAISSSL